MTLRTDIELPPPDGDAVARRRLLAVSAGAAGAAAAGRASADSLADVPPREPGEPLNERSERSKYVKLSRIPEAGPAVRHIDPYDAINSKTPQGKLVGTITPTDLHYERSHSGVPDLDPAKHRLLIHGMTKKALALAVDDIIFEAVGLSHPLHRVHRQRMGELEEGR
jgi:sulfane dehydrogenase subunit SoxC